jgi:hypothetical protein
VIPVKQQKGESKQGDGSNTSYPVWVRVRSISAHMLFALPAGIALEAARAETRLLGLAEQIGWVDRTSCHRSWQWWTATRNDNPLGYEEGRAATVAEGKAAVLKACERLGWTIPNASAGLIRNPDVVAMQELREFMGQTIAGRA